MDKKKKCRITVIVVAVLAFFCWTRGWLDHRPINLLDFSAEEVTSLHISGPWQNTVPDIIDKEDIQFCIDSTNGLRRAGNTLKYKEGWFPFYVGGGPSYVMTFCMEDGQEIVVSIGAIRTPYSEHRTKKINLTYGIDPTKYQYLRNRIAAPVAKGSLAFFYELYDKYVPA